VDGRKRVARDEELVGHLRQYRQDFTQKIIDDASATIDELGLSDGPGDGVMQAAGDALRAGLDTLKATDAWSTSRAELQAWNAVHDFYHDALTAAERQYDLTSGHRRPIGQVPRRRCMTPGGASFGRVQAALNAMELGIPGALDIRPFRGALAVLRYDAVRRIAPWPPWRVGGYLAATHHMLTSGALSSYADGEKVLERSTLDAFVNDDYFFDRANGRTRHNIIIAKSHRHSFLDLPFMWETLRDVPFACWSNIQYFPKSAATDPQIIVVNPGETRRLDATLDRTAELAIEQGKAISSYVDGGTPYLLYGQQMRVKPGIRLLVDKLVAGSAGTPRKTYIVPVSFDDTTALARGIEKRVSIVVHPPICADDIDPPPNKPDRKSLNRGDPLPTHLEALFLTRTAQVRHGWRRPQVVDAVSARRTQPARFGLRPWIRRHTFTTLYDVARFTWRKGQAVATTPKNS
jgi:hypothetical protein